MRCCSPIVEGSPPRGPLPREILVRLGAALAALALLVAPVLAQDSGDCLLCHSDRDLTLQRRGRTVSLFVDAAQLQHSTHASLSCVDCHEGLSAGDLPHARVIRPVACSTCHDADAYERSVHGRTVATEPTDRRPRATCKTCHGTHGILAPSDPQSQTSRRHLGETCGKCHAEVAAHYEKSAHGAALVSGIAGAPTCIDCHGEHDVEPIASSDSPVSKRREARVCLHCHLDNPEVRARVGPSAGFIAGYETSVHGISLASGNENAATCSDCHGAHDMQRGSNPASLVHRSRIAQTCSRCHQDISRVYGESIHGSALSAGIQDAPTCTSCHGEHQIYAPQDPRSRVAPRNVSVEVCAPCHTSLQLTQKYELASERFESFADSYHGLASKAGAVEVANCASCHGVHNIKPSSDPASTIHKDNLAKTCGQCHPGATENFAKGSVHLLVSRNGDSILYWIQFFYVSLIVVTVGGMAAHNAADLVKKARVRHAQRLGSLPEEHFGNTQFVRMTLSERIQHGTMLTSFFVLVITGFMLKFPDAWWVLAIRRLSESVFEVRSIAHRIAGIAMIGVCIYHLYYIIAVRRGRELFRDFLPRVEDLRQARDNLIYNLGISRNRPMFGRYSYVEKAEYWALVWGTAVMALTGIILWFDNYFMNLLTKLGWDIASTVHYYEAWLATLAILVWHLYYVIFNPDVYPMNMAWWTGRISEEEMAKEHPVEFARLQAERLEAESVKEPPEGEGQASMTSGTAPSGSS